MSTQPIQLELFETNLEELEAAKERFLKAKKQNKIRFALSFLTNLEKEENGKPNSQVRLVRHKLEDIEQKMKTPKLAPEGSQEISTRGRDFPDQTCL